MKKMLLRMQTAALTLELVFLFEGCGISMSRDSHISIALGRNQTLRLFLFRGIEPPSCLPHARDSIEA